MKTERTLPYQVGPLRKVALLIFLPNMLIASYLLYQHFHETPRWQPHEKMTRFNSLVRSRGVVVIIPHLIFTAAMFVDCLVTRTIFSESQIRHMPAIQRPLPKLQQSAPSETIT